MSVAVRVTLATVWRINRRREIPVECLESGGSHGSEPWVPMGQNEMVDWARELEERGHQG